MISMPFIYIKVLDIYIYIYGWICCHEPATTTLIIHIYELVCCQSLDQFIVMLLSIYAHCPLNIVHTPVYILLILMVFWTQEARCYIVIHVRSWSHAFPYVCLVCLLPGSWFHIYIHIYEFLAFCSYLALLILYTVTYVSVDGTTISMSLQISYAMSLCFYAVTLDYISLLISPLIIYVFIYK